MRGVSMGHTQVRACCFIRGATRAKAVLGRHFVSLHYQVAGSATGGGNPYNINYTRLFRNLPWARRLLTMLYHLCFLRRASPYGSLGRDYRWSLALWAGAATNVLSIKNS